MMDGNARSPTGPDRGPGHVTAAGPGRVTVDAARPVHCADCGRSIDPGDRYCGHCGLPNTAGNGEVATRDGAGSNRVGPISAAAVAALVLLGATVAWTVLTEGDDGGSAAQQLPVGDLDPLLSDSVVEDPTDNPSVAVAASSLLAGIEVPPPVEVQTITAAAVTALDDIDALRGHYLFVGAGTAMLRLDFDTGELDQYALTGAVLGHYRDRLLLLDENGISTVSVDRPLRAPHQLLALEEDLDLHGAEVTSARWLELTYAPSDSQSLASSSSIIIDLRDKSIVSTSAEWRDAVGTVAWVPGGGVFQLTDNGYDFLTDGRVGLIGRDSLYIENCTEPDQCRSRWVDRSSGETIDRPLLPAGLFFGEMVGGGDRLAAFYGPAASRAFYYDTIRGEALPMNVTRPSESLTTAGRRSAAVSPDDRLLMTLPNGRELWFFDLDTSRAFGLDLPVGNARTVALVPKPMPEASGAG